MRYCLIEVVTKAGFTVYGNKQARKVLRNSN